MTSWISKINRTKKYKKSLISRLIANKQDLYQKAIIFFNKAEKKNNKKKNKWLRGKKVKIRIKVEDQIVLVSNLFLIVKEWKIRL